MELEDFQKLPFEKQRAQIDTAGRGDRSGLSSEHLAALEEADRRVMNRWEGKLPEPEVTDRRTRPQQIT